MTEKWYLFFLTIITFLCNVQGNVKSITHEKIISDVSDSRCAVFVTTGDRHVKTGMDNTIPFIYLSPYVSDKVLLDALKYCNIITTSITEKTKLLKFMRRKVLRVSDNYIFFHHDMNIFQSDVFHQYLNSLYVIQNANGQPILLKRRNYFKNDMDLIKTDEFTVSIIQVLTSIALKYFTL